MSAIVDIIIQADDKASSVFGGLTVTLGDVLNIAGAVGGGLVDMFKSVVQESMDAQEGQAQLGAVLEATGGKAGVTADQANELASALQLTTKFTDDQVLSTENMLLTFTNISKDVFPDVTKTALDMSQALGQDTKASAIQLGKALNDPIKGVSALSKVGVSFTQVQKDQIKALVEAGDTMGAQKIILAELGNEFGGAAEAAGKTFAGQMAILSHQFDDVKQQIGDALLPVLGQLMGYIGSVGMPIIQAFGTWMGTNLPIAIAYVSQTAIPMLNAAWATIQSVWQTSVQPIFQQLVTWFQVTIPQAIAFVNTHWEEFKGAIIAIGAVLAAGAIIGTIASIAATIATLASPIGLIIGAAALLGAAWAGNWGGIQEKTAAAWAAIQPVFNTVVTWLQTNIPIAAQATADFWTNTLQPALMAVGLFIQTQVIPVLIDIYTWLKTNIPPALVALAGFWTGTLQPALNAVWSFISTILIPIFTVLVNDAIKIVQTEVRLLSEVWTNVLQPALNTVWAFISANILPILQAVGTFLSDTLSPVITTISDLLSDQLTKAFGSAKDAIGPVQTAINDVGNAISGAIGWVQKFIDKLDDIHVPSILTQHSPSILEQSLLDVSSAAHGAADGVERVGQSTRNMPSTVKGFSGNASAGSSSSTKSGGDTYHIDARGSTLTAGQFEASIKKVNNETGAKALSRLRTGN